MRNPIAQSSQKSISDRKTIQPSKLMLYLVGPYGCAAVSYVVFIVSFLMPPIDYESIIHEPDLMFLNFRLALFFSGCTACYILGVYVSSRRTPNPLVQRSCSPDVIIFVNSIIVALNVLSLLITIRSSPGLVGTLLNSGGNTVKQTLDTEGAFTEATPLLMGAFWWSYTQSRLFSKDDLRWRMVNVLIWVSLFLVVIISIVDVARFYLMPFLVGVCVIVMAVAAIRQRVNLFTVYAIPVGSLVLVVMLFLGFSVMRGAATSQAQNASFIGYTASSFNRLAALLEGRLTYAYTSTGIYVGRFIQHAPGLSKIVDLGSVLNLPDPLIVFRSEFTSVKNAGLNGDYIWPTALGYYYLDMGPLVFPFCVIIGLATKASWNSLKFGGAIGSVMYPFLSSSVLLWCTTNLMTQPRLITLLVSAVFFSLLSRRSAAKPGRKVSNGQGAVRARRR